MDIDWMDPAFIKSLPRKPHDQTSNQLWMGIQLAQTSNTELLKTTAKELKAEGWLATYSKMVSLTKHSGRWAFSLIQTNLFVFHRERSCAKKT